MVRYTVTNHDVSRYNAASLAGKTIWNGASQRDVRAIIQRTRPDVMHVHNPFPLLSPSIYGAARSEHVPVVQTLHNFRLLCPKATLRRGGEVDLLRRHGHTVTEYVDDNRRIGAMTRASVALDTIWSQSTYANLSKRLAMEKPDVVHVTTSFPSSRHRRTMPAATHRWRSSGRFTIRDSFAPALHLQESDAARIGRAAVTACR